MKKKNNMRRHKPGLERTNAERVASIGKCAPSGVYIRGPNVANREESRKGLINGNCPRAWRNPGPCRCIAGACGPALPVPPGPKAFPGVSSSEREARPGFHSLGTAGVLDRGFACGPWEAPEPVGCLEASRFSWTVVPSR